jgi:amidase
VDDDPTLWSATRQASAIRAGDLTSSALLDAQLARMEAVNPDLNAVVTLDADGARAEAAALDRMASEGRLKGPLHGLPVTVKDAIEVRGMRSTGGSASLGGYFPLVDAPAVSRLRAAGALVMGKTNCPEWSADVQTYNQLFGTTNNPWDPGRTPGGSSGGAAAAVATGMSSFELGTDIGGSVRIPSAFCGICGHKPSYGLIPQRGYLDHPGGGTIDVDINVFGPLARSVDDLELLFDVLAGPLDADAVAWRLQVPPARSPSPADWRVAVWDYHPAAPAGADVRSAVRLAGGVLSDAGARVGEDRPAVDMAESSGVFTALLMAAMSPSLEPADAEAFGGSHFAWLTYQERRQLLLRAWSDFFADHDALVCPVAPVPAFPHQQEGTFMDRTVDVDGSAVPMPACVAWTGLVGVAQLPATVVPVTWSAAGGLPVAVQVVGPRLEDRTPLAVARFLLERRGGWRPPPLP